METTKQIIITKVKLVKDGIRINYEKYRDSYWDTLQLTSKEKAAPEFYDAFQYLGSHIAAIMSFTGEIMEHRIRPNEVVLAYSSSCHDASSQGAAIYHEEPYRSRTPGIPCYPDVGSCTASAG